MMFKLVVYTDKYQVRFRHDGEEPIEKISSNLVYGLMTVQEIHRQRGDNFITHLCMWYLKTLTGWLPDIAPDLTQLRLVDIDEKSLRDGRFNWQR